MQSYLTMFFLSKTRCKVFLILSNDYAFKLLNERSWKIYLGIFIELLSDYKFAQRIIMVICYVIWSLVSCHWVLVKTVITL